MASVLSGVSSWTAQQASKKHCLLVCIRGGEGRGDNGDRYDGVDGGCGFWQEIRTCGRM
jgi:hypothetical protein